MQLACLILITLVLPDNRVYRGIFVTHNNITTDRGNSIRLTAAYAESGLNTTNAMQYLEMIVEPTFLSFVEQSSETARL